MWYKAVSNHLEGSRINAEDFGRIMANIDTLLSAETRSSEPADSFDAPIYDDLRIYNEDYYYQLKRQVANKIYEWNDDHPDEEITFFASSADFKSSDGINYLEQKLDEAIRTIIPPQED